MKYIKYSALIVMSFTIIGGFSASHAHNGGGDDDGTLPECETVANDPDGDGFGWVPHAAGAHSCIVNERTNPKPLYATVANERRPLNMIRTYWDPNVDFANKEIECTRYRDDTAFSASELEFATGAVTTIMHYPLPDIAPWRSEFEISYIEFGTETTKTGVWRSANGTYIGDQLYANPSGDDVIALLAGNWGEPINIDGQQGMRFWEGTFSQPFQSDIINGDVYQECKYTSGEPFRPTGNFDQAPTQSGQTNFESPTLAAGPPIGDKPEITNKATNEVINLQSFSWNIADDLLFKKIMCLDRDWNGDFYDTFEATAASYIFMPPLPGKTNGHVYYKVFDSRSYTNPDVFEWSVVNGELTAQWPANPLRGIKFPFDSGWYETRMRTGESGDVDVSTDGMRVWHDEDTYDTCWLDLDHEAFGETLRPTGAVSSPTAVVNPVETEAEAEIEIETETETETETDQGDGQQNTDSNSQIGDVGAGNTPNAEQVDSSATANGNESGGGAFGELLLLILFSLFPRLRAGRHR